MSVFREPGKQDLYIDAVPAPNKPRRAPLSLQVFLYLALGLHLARAVLGVVLNWPESRIVSAIYVVTAIIVLAITYFARRAFKVWP